MLRLWGAITRGGAVRACLVVGAVLVALATAGWAAEPHPWQLGMQPPATPVKERIHAFHNELLVIISLITLFVMGLLGYVMVRFRARRPSARTICTACHTPASEAMT